MIDKIVLDLILTIIGFIVTGILGYLTAKIKTYKQKEEVQQEALKCLLRSSITSKYYVYTELGAIPYYEKENINYMFSQYEAMKGNSYVSKIVDEINKLPIKK